MEGKGNDDNEMGEWLEMMRPTLALLPPPIHRRKPKAEVMPERGSSEGGSSGASHRGNRRPSLGLYPSTWYYY
eukprot:2033291-Rhodomonas_salina.1